MTSDLNCLPTSGDALSAEVPAISISRRGVLGAALAFAVAPRAEASLPAGNVIPLPPAEVVPPVACAPEFGFTVGCNDLWQMGFSSREAAVAAALETTLGENGLAFQTAEVLSHDVQYPDDIGEVLVNALMNEERLGNTLVEALICCNEEGDFEGCFSDACWLQDRSQLGDSGRVSFSAALRRAGQDELAAKVAASEILPLADLTDDVVAVIESDGMLADEIGAALRVYVEAHSLDRDLRGIMTTKVQSHPAPEMTEEAMLEETVA